LCKSTEEGTEKNRKRRDLLTEGRGGEGKERKEKE